ncbi:hypothetical protein MRX96_011516 [Rhipicephalus microplus]
MGFQGAFITVRGVSGDLCNDAASFADSQCERRASRSGPLTSGCASDHKTKAEFAATEVGEARTGARFRKNRLAELRRVRVCRGPVTTAHSYFASRSLRLALIDADCLPPRTVRSVQQCGSAS